jgi:hypothetical protein
VSAGAITSGSATRPVQFGVRQRNVTPQMQLAFGGLTGFSVQRYSAGVNPPIINLSKSNTGTVGAQGLVQTTDVLGEISFDGSDGVKLVQGAAIRAEVDGTPGVNDMPTRLVFYTTADSAAVPVEAMRIANNNVVTLAGGLAGTTASFSLARAAGGPLTLVDTTASGKSWQMGVGAGNTANAFNLYNVTDAAQAFTVANGTAPTVTFTGTVSAPGAQTQMVFTETGTVATGSTLIPADNTIPQITEGDQYMTLAIVPKSATSKLIIEVTCVLYNTVANNMGVVLFQDATANALAAVHQTIAAGQNLTMSFRHIMTSGTTSSTTFRVRAGGNNAGTTTFNGTNAVQLYGGVCASSIVIREVV